MRRDSNGAPVPEGSLCDSTGKKMWSSRQQAKLVARRVNPGQHMSAYRCEGCDWFHIGHMPQIVKAGDLDRGELRPKGTP